uniref:Uncharacterized protein n=1 Tax=Nelumbo nucifera TaxID=4432 RepID=A0A822XJV9_NELNU|nr:TPA_asm: hypothetical protein HUJ06_022040 [Nelumbo nucifera]
MIKLSEQSAELKEQQAKHDEDIRAVEARVVVAFRASHRFAKEMDKYATSAMKEGFKLCHKLVSSLTLEYDISSLVKDTVSPKMVMEVHNEVDSRGDEVSQEDDFEENVMRSVTKWQVA